MYVGNHEKNITSESLLNDIEATYKMQKSDRETWCFVVLTEFNSEMGVFLVIDQTLGKSISPTPFLQLKGHFSDNHNFLNFHSFEINFRSLSSFQFSLFRSGVAY